MRFGCIGELVIDFICPDEVHALQDAGHFIRCAGGSPANVSAMLHAAGFEVTLVSRVGKDAYGRYLLDLLDRIGIPARAVSTDPVHPTRCVFLAHDAAGRRYIEVANRNSADQYIGPEQVVNLGALDVLHVGGTTLLGEITGNTMLDLAGRVKRAGRYVTFDPNINIRRISPAVRKRMAALLPMVDLLKVNEEEWKMMQGLFGVTASSFVTVVCTRGDAGASVFNDQRQFDIAPDAVKAKDVTGAGDAFFAGFIIHLASHAPGLPETLPAALFREALAAGVTHATRTIGAMGGPLAQLAASIEQ